MNSHYYVPKHERRSGDGAKNTLKLPHGMKSTLKAPNLGIALATRELPLKLKICVLTRPQRLQSHAYSRTRLEPSDCTAT